MKIVASVVNLIGDSLLWSIDKLLRLHRFLRKRGKNINGFHR